MSAYYEAEYSQIPLDSTIDEAVFFIEWRSQIKSRVDVAKSKVLVLDEMWTSIRDSSDLFRKCKSSLKKVDVLTLSFSQGVKKIRAINSISITICSNWLYTL